MTLSKTTRTKRRVRRVTVAPKHNASPAPRTSALTLLDLPVEIIETILMHAYGRRSLRLVCKTFAEVLQPSDNQLNLGGCTRRYADAINLISKKLSGGVTNPPRELTQLSHRRAWKQMFRSMFKKINITSAAEFRELATTTLFSVCKHTCFSTRWRPCGVHDCIRLSISVPHSTTTKFPARKAMLAHLAHSVYKIDFCGPVYAKLCELLSQTAAAYMASCLTEQ